MSFGLGVLKEHLASFEATAGRPSRYVVAFSGGLDSTVLLHALATIAREQGTELLACGTCLGYYELKDKLAVGTVSNMYTIAETILVAARVVSL